MKAEEVLTILGRTFDDAATKGARVIDVAALKELLVGLRKVAEANSTQTAAQEQKRTEMSFENWIETNKQRHEWKLEEFRSVITAGQAALKSCILINGGASVALLAFVGHLVEQGIPAIPLQSLAKAMAVFVGGVFCGGLASGFTYLPQWFFAGEWRKTGFMVNIAAIVGGLASLGLFCWGGYIAYFAVAGGG